MNKAQPATQRLSDIRARLAAVPGGEWTAKRYTIECRQDEPGDSAVFAAVSVDGRELCNTTDEGTEAPIASLIASAPTDLAWLLDRLEKAEELLRDTRIPDCSSYSDEHNIKTCKRCRHDYDRANAIAAFLEGGE